MVTENYSPRLILLGFIVSALTYSTLSWLNLEQPIVFCLSITILTAFFWISGAVPIPAASLLPFVLLPLTGVLTYQQAASGLGSHIIILLMGGFMIAKGIEKSQLHHRFALAILTAVGGRGGKRLVLAFMLCGALLSMWISNTAACLVLLPIALAVLKQVDDDSLIIPVLLGIAFSCNLGGIATLIGTPPNLIFAGVYQSISAEEYGFMRWMKVGGMVVAIGLPLMAIWLSRNVTHSKPIALPTLQQWSAAEKRVLGIFLLIIFLWVFRLEPFGGWSQLTGITSAGDSTIALLGVVLMFIVSNGASGHSKQALLDWKTAADIPWGMLLLFAGGLAIAKAFQVSGTATLIGNLLSSTVVLHPFLLMLAICLVVTFLTEITSNTATTTLLMPILGAAATSSQIPIELMMVPAAMSASCAFMLPVATAPNAIVFGSGAITVRQMAKEGLVLNLIMAVIISTVCYLML